MKAFDHILEKHPKSPRALYGRARGLDDLAEKEKSNKLLVDAIDVYKQIFWLRELPDALTTLVGERIINRLRFIGRHMDAVNIHENLISKFDKNPHYKNQLALTYLMINKLSDAKRILHETLLLYPKDGFAQVHYGFVLKVYDNNMEHAVRFLKAGIESGENGTMDGRFYYHLGDALTRLGRRKEAYEIYELGVKNKLFASKYQRSLYNVDSLTARPWWTKEETKYEAFFNTLETELIWHKMLNEGLNVLSTPMSFQKEDENLQDVGDWKQFELFSKGKKNKENCRKAPFTCRIIEMFQSASGCRRGQTKFSIMYPGTHVWPHCGPTNCRLRAHLGLQVPPNTFIRVADSTRSWQDGSVIIFDDSFEHEVWHNGTTPRLVLIIDFWHPDLTLKEKQSLSAI